MLEPTREQQVAHAQLALRYVSNSATPANAAISEFRTLLFSRPENSTIPEIMAEGLFRTPELRASDTLFFNRAACAVVLEALRPEALEAQFAFTSSLRSGINFVRQMSAELVRKFRQDADEGNLSLPDDPIEPDYFYRRFREEVAQYVDASMAILDLAKQKQVLPCFKGVLAESTILALETPDSIEVLMARERTCLNIFFLGECINTLRLEEPHKLTLLDRLKTSAQTGQQNDPYDYSVDQRRCVVDPHEPIRFAKTNMGRPTFVEALRDMPKMVAIACDLAA